MPFKDPEKRRQNEQERKQRRRLQAITMLENRCVVCESKDKLEFDHKDPTTKTFNISANLNCSNDRFWKEVEKCQLLCRKHHLDKTANERKAGVYKGCIGENNPSSKLRDLDVIYIHLLFNAGYSVTQITKEFSVNHSTISRIVSGKLRIIRPIEE